MTILKSIIVRQLLLVLLVTTPLGASAYSSYQEIDDYYDSQIKAVEDETARKNKAVEDQLQKDLDAIDAKTLERIWAMYREVYGDQFEMVKPFLPESNPDPALHASNLMNFDRATALRAISNIRAINPSLADRVLAIYEGKSTTSATAKPSAVAMFEYIDSLSPDQASDAFNKLKYGDPQMYKEVLNLIDLKYPNGKPGSARHDEYLASLRSTQQVTATPGPITNNRPSPASVVNTISEEQNEETSVQETAPETAISVTEEELDRMVEERIAKALEQQTTEQPAPKPSFLQRVKNFFGRWF